MLAIYASICNRNLHVNVYVPYCVKKVLHCALVCIVCIFLHITNVYPSYNNVTVKHMSFVREVFSCAK